MTTKLIETEMTYGSELRRIREEVGVSISHVARSLGVTTQYLSRIELGLKPPPANHFRTLEILQAIRRPDEWRHLVALSVKHYRRVMIDLTGMPDYFYEIMTNLQVSFCEDSLSREQWGAIGDILKEGNRT